MTSPGKLRSRVLNVSIILGAIALLLLLALTIVNILFRLGGYIISGSYELAEVLIPIVAGTAILVATLRGSHVGVDLVVERMSARLRCVAAIFVLACGAVYWAIVAGSSGIAAVRSTMLGEYTELFGLPVAPLRWFWALVAVCVAVYLLYSAVAKIRGSKE